MGKEQLVAGGRYHPGIAAGSRRSAPSASPADGPQESQGWIVLSGRCAACELRSPDMHFDMHFNILIKVS